MLYIKNHDCKIKNIKSVTYIAILPVTVGYVYHQVKIFGQILPVFLLAKIAKYG